MPVTYLVVLRMHWGFFITMGLNVTEPQDSYRNRHCTKNQVFKKGFLHFLCSEGFRVLNNSLVFPEMSLSILIDKNLQRREKGTFAIFSVVKFFEHNILQTHKLK